jgi:glycosyltransferase involved in cell wall biosynthesis
MTDTKAIAFLCHPYHRGGVTRWMADAAMWLANKNFKVYFITVAPVKRFVSAGNRETLVELLTKTKTSVEIISARVGYEFEFGTPEYKAFIYQKLLSKVPQGTPVILSDDASVWEAGTGLSAAYPIVGVLHADEQIYYTLAAKYYQQVSLMACVSERVNRKVKDAVNGLDHAKVVTIPCGINLPAMPVSKQHGVLQIAYSGRLSEYQKRVYDLAAVCTELEKDTAFHLNIMGEGESKAALEQKFKDAGLEHNVTFHGWLSQQQVLQQLSDSDLLMLTSDFEGMPIAMMEALACGCGFVGTRVSGIEDCESHPLAADCFRVFNVGDTADAAKKIKEIAAILQQSRQNAARKLAETEFSLDVCMDRYLTAMGLMKYISAPGPKISLPILRLIYSKLVSTARYLKVKAKK